MASVLCAAVLVLCMTGEVRGEGADPTYKADAATESAVLDVLDKFNEAFMAKDLDAALELFADSPGLVFIGTGEDEKRIGLDELRIQLQRDFEQVGTAAWEWGWRSVFVSGTTAWMAADIVLQAIIGGEEKRYSGRLTVVLEKINDKWLIVQWHGSLPAAGQAVGESYPQK